MRSAFTAACFLVVLVLGMMLGGIITERKVAPFLESECAQLDLEEERAEKRIAMNRLEPQGIRWVEAAEWDARGMGRMAR